MNIKTWVEIQGGRVKVQETETETTVTIVHRPEPQTEPSRNLYTEQEVEDKVGEAMATAKGLRERIQEQHEKTIGRLEIALKNAEIRAGGYDLDRKAEQKRADENRDWAERAEAEANERIERLERDHVRSIQARNDQLAEKSTKVVDLESRIQELEGRIVIKKKMIEELSSRITEKNETIDAFAKRFTAVQQVVSAPSMDAALTFSGVPTLTANMQNAIKAVRRILTGGSLPSPDAK